MDNGPHGAIGVSRDEIERLAKIDDEMAGQNRHVLKLTVNFNLKPRGTGIKDRDKTIVGVGAKPPVRRAGVVVHEVEKRITSARGVTP